MNRKLHYVKKNTVHVNIQQVSRRWLQMNVILVAIICFKLKLATAYPKMV